MPAWAESACAEYAQRMPKGYELRRVNLKPERLPALLPKSAQLVALDEHGKDLSTVQFSKLLQTETAFVIGAADGLDEALKARAKLLLRLSSLTLPHALAQVVLVEQIYRAATLLTGHPYHRA